MKVVLKPQESEEAIYYSDFTGKLLPDSEIYGPPINVEMAFNYGSQYDGEKLELHLDDDDFKKILQFLKNNLNSDYTKVIEKFV